MAAKKGNTYALGNKGGRPTKVTSDLIEKAKEYLKQCRDELEDVVTQSKGKNVVTTSKKLKKVSLPSMAGLARWLDVSRETVYAWQSENKEFSDTCQEIMAEQEKRLLDNGLAGNYNPVISKLLLTKHGYTDKADITSDGKALTLQFDATFTPETAGNS